MLERKIIPFEEPIDPVIKTNLAVVAGHFRDEASNNMAGVIDSYTDDIVWKDPERGEKGLVLEGKDAAADNYRGIFSGMKKGSIEFETLWRSAGKKYVFSVDIIRFTVTADEHFSGYQKGERGEMRLVHLFGMRNGKICKELVYERPI